MQTMIVKWGNSQGICIPKAFLENINVSENEPVDITLENEKIIIKKTNSKKHKTIKEHFVEFYGVDFGQTILSQKKLIGVNR
jgi:antitoxin component of MazEF toxin-antitoxin module